MIKTVNITLSDSDPTYFCHLHILRCQCLLTLVDDRQDRRRYSLVENGMQKSYWKSFNMNTLVSALGLPLFQSREFQA